MNIRIWGCRGSLTTPGKETLRYGGETTCIEILSGNNERIIIDAGSGIRRSDTLENAFSEINFHRSASEKNARSVCSSTFTETGETSFALVVR
jgi:hypothetical protein